MTRAEILHAQNIHAMLGIWDWLPPAWPPEPEPPALSAPSAPSIEPRFIAHLFRRLRAPPPRFRWRRHHQGSR